MIAAAVDLRFLFSRIEIFDKERDLQKPEHEDEGQSYLVRS